MGTEDLERWLAFLARKGGGFPVRVRVFQVDSDRTITTGTVWRLGPTWDDDEDDDDGGPSLRSLVPLDEGIDVDDDTREEADSGFERLVLMAVERPAIISNFVSGVVDIATPAIDRAMGPIVETLIDQVSERSAEKVEARMREVLTEMLEFEDEPGRAPGDELTELRDLEELEQPAELEELPELEPEPDEEEVLLARLEELEAYGDELEGLEGEDLVDKQIEICWRQRQQREALELEQPAEAT